MLAAKIARRAWPRTRRDGQRIISDDFPSLTRHPVMVLNRDQALHPLGTTGLGMIAPREKRTTGGQLVTPKQSAQRPSVIGLLVKSLHRSHQSSTVRMAR